MPLSSTANRIELPLQTRLLPVASVNSKARTATVVFSTGARVRRMDWIRGQEYVEELAMTPDAVRLDRLNAGAPLLKVHNRYELESIIGVVERAWIDKGEGLAEVRFSERDDVTPIFRDVEGGVIRAVSAGYRVHRIEQLPPDERSEGLPVYRVTDWSPMEISLVPIGADDGAKVRAEGQKLFPATITTKGNSTMPDPNPEAERHEDARPSPAEQYRTRTIVELCRRHNIPEATREDLLGRGATVAEVREAVLDYLAKQSEPGAIRSGHMDGFQTNADLGPQGQRALMVEALAWRMGGPKPSERAMEYANMRMMDMMRWCLELRTSTRGMSATEIFERSFGSLHGTSDFPELLTGAGNRTLRDAYQAHQSGITKVFKQATVPDFRARQKLALSEFPAMVEVPQSGEFKRGSMSETKEAYIAKTYGRIFGLTRQSIINDDTGAFSDMTMRAGQAAAELQANTLTALVNSNPTLTQDSTAVFATGHANLTTGTGAAAINVDNIGTGVNKIRQQKGISGNIVLGLGPRYLLVPSALEQVARQYTSANYQPATADAQNPWTPMLEPVVEPRLDAFSTVAWYLFADPAMLDCFEYSYLEGEGGPQLFLRDGWDRDGVEFKVRMDLGAGAVEYRGAYKNAGE